MKSGIVDKVDSALYSRLRFQAETTRTNASTLMQFRELTAENVKPIRKKQKLAHFFHQK